VVRVVIIVVVLACGAVAVLARAHRHVGIVVAVENVARMDGGATYI
jgi:hypothetical protein